MIVLGSKSIGLAVARAVGGRVLTYDDSHDPRSRLGAFLGLGAELVDPKAIVLDEPTIVAGWYWKLPASTLARPIYGLHNSLLPKFRGGSPLVWTMIRGERKAGVSIFELTDQMDAGPVWGQASTRVGPDETIAEVSTRLERDAVHLVRDLVAGRLAPRTQDESKATYVPQRKPDDGLIDWAWAAKRVHDFVRAQTRPWPGAFDVRGGRRVSVWRTRLRSESATGRPGEVHGNRVVCGDKRSVEILDPPAFAAFAVGRGS